MKRANIGRYTMQSKTLGMLIGILSTIPEEIRPEVLEALKDPELYQDNTRNDGIPALRRRILDEYGSTKAFAGYIGMRVETLRKALKGGREFTRDELASISEQLHLTDEEVVQYFFPELYREGA